MSITIKPTTIGSLVLELPFCPDSIASAIELGPRKEGHTRALLREQEAEEFLLEFVIQLCQARKLLRDRKEKEGLHD